MTKIDRVIAAAAAFGAEHLGPDTAATLKIVGLPMHGEDGCERWLVRADSAHDLLLVDVALRLDGDVSTKHYVF